MFNCLAAQFQLGQVSPEMASNPTVSITERWALLNCRVYIKAIVTQTDCIYKSYLFSDLKLTNIAIEIKCHYWCSFAQTIQELMINCKVIFLFDQQMAQKNVSAQSSKKNGCALRRNNPLYSFDFVWSSL